VPRAGLSTRRVVEEAEALADERGLSEVGIATIAARVGVRAPSLYKHVTSLDALLQLLAVRAKSELARTLSEASAGAEPGAAIPAIATAYRRWAHAHPGRYSATLRAPLASDPADIEASSRAVAVILDALDTMGITGGEAIDATRAIRSALHGFVALEAAHAFELPEVDASFDRMITALCYSIENWHAATMS
jgi:AcrR family transcriptional regulator